jgi:hypothetical protein
MSALATSLSVNIAGNKPWSLPIDIFITFSIDDTTAG